MTKYRYRATNAKGKTVSGTMDATGETDLYAKLREQQMFMISCEAEQEKNKSKKIKTKVLAEFSRQMGTLLTAGVSLVRALGIIANDEMVKKSEKAVYESVLVSVRQGTPLSDAMEEQGNAFPPLMINMYRSAEASGDLDKVALRMSSHYDKEYRMQSKIKTAMMYPCFLLGLIVVVILVLFTFVMPQFQELFAQMESLPFLTRMVMGFSDIVKGYWWLFILIITFLVILIRILLRVPSIRYQKDKTKVHMPVFGKLLQVVYTARFARTLSSLYAAGLPIVTALQISAKTIGNTYIETQFNEATAKVRAGGNLSDALMGIDGFIRKLASSIMVGEETGSLDSMLDSTADELDYESEMAISRMLAFLEPIMIIIMAIIVAVVIISVMMPLYGSYDAIGGAAD